VPVEVLDFIDGYVFLAEETPEFIARNLVSRLTQYAETLKTPFFGVLVDYAQKGNQLWTCPGHNGGIFYSRSPIGRISRNISERRCFGTTRDCAFFMLQRLNLALQVDARCVPKGCVSAAQYWTCELGTMNLGTRKNGARYV
jgi:hypothetical protein